jgi:hypothetical protein
VIVIGIGVRITASEGSDDAESRFFSPDHSSVMGESRFAWSGSQFQWMRGGQIQYAEYVIRDTDTAAMVL